MDENSKKKSEEPFRFLKPHEYAALTQEGKVIYLKQAVEAIKGGALQVIKPTASDE